MAYEKNNTDGYQVPLSIGVGIPDETFASFCEDDRCNAIPFYYLKSTFDSESYDDGRFLYLYGPHGSGKTHLLKSVAVESNRRNINCAMLDIASLITFSNPNLLSGLEQNCQIICLDNIDAIAGKADWENELFALYNRWQSMENGFFIVVAHENVEKSGFKKRDLVTRLESGASLNIKPLPYERIAEALVLREQAKGNSLDANKAKKIAKSSKDITSAVEALKRINKAVQQNKNQKITKTIIEEVINK